MAEIIRHIQWIRHHVYWIRMWIHRKPKLFDPNLALKLLAEAGEELELARNLIEQ